jgi:hypothetical protein
MEIIRDVLISPMDDAGFNSDDTQKLGQIIKNLDVRNERLKIMSCPKMY